jgi:hypothetical protein
MHLFGSVLFLLRPNGSPVGGWCVVILPERETGYPDLQMTLS